MFKCHCLQKGYSASRLLQVKIFDKQRDIEELLKIRGITVDHATIQRWVFKFTHLIDQNFRKRKLPTGLRWRLDETYIEVNSKWCYLHRAVDKEGKNIDFLLIYGRKKRAAHCFLTKAIT